MFRGRPTYQRPSSFGRKEAARQRKRIVRWSLVAVYTVLLPFAIIPFRFIRDRFSAETAALVPVWLVIACLAVYLIFWYRKRSGYRFLVTLGLVSPMVLLIFFCQSNPNKHIHIPEYILMAVLVYRALAVDYQGRGVLLLCLSLSSLAGVIDEIQQGMHVHRYYGLSDMGVNSLSSLVGVLLLRDLTDRMSAGWDWGEALRRSRLEMGVMVAGIASAVWLCRGLFTLKAAGGHSLAIPFLQAVLHVGFLLAGGGMVVRLLSRLSPKKHRVMKRGRSRPRRLPRNAVVWYVSLFLMLFVIHILGLFAWFLPWKFL